LDDIGFVWDPHDTNWENGFAALQIFEEREKHCRVPSGHTEGDYSLGNWVTAQRTFKDAMPSYRRQRLDELGFVWDPVATLNTENWEEGLAVLLMFKEREGHCKVKQKYKEGDFPLGLWVKYQRRYKHTPERRQQLDEIGFDWGKKQSEPFEEGIAALLMFKEREGHCKVKQKYKEGEFPLGLWVKAQRRYKHTPERRQQLDEIGFDWGGKRT
jgi:hypothetical protein